MAISEISKRQIYFRRNISNSTKGFKFTSFPEIILPRMVEVHQKIPSPKLKDPLSKTRKELAKAGLRRKIWAGARIAITAGSRGLAHYPKILATVVDEVKKAGTDPFQSLPWGVMVALRLRGRCAC